MNSGIKTYNTIIHTTQSHLGVTKMNDDQIGSHPLIRGTEFNSNYIRKQCVAAGRNKE